MIDAMINIGLLILAECAFGIVVLTIYDLWKVRKDNE